MKHKLPPPPDPDPPRPLGGLTEEDRYLRSRGWAIYYRKGDSEPVWARRDGRLFRESIAVRMQRRADEKKLRGGLE